MSNYTELSTLGEFGLIDHLTKTIRLQNPSTLKGIGDDAAVLDYGNKKILVSTDMLIQGIHFDLTYTPLKHLGYKSVAVNASDIYAMNGIPKQITLSLAVSNHFSVEGLEEFYAGLYLACEKYGIDLVGGDTTSSKTGMCISITVLGEADEQDIVYRNTAKEHQLICVSGDLGAAYMGLQLLEREKLVFQGDENAQPDFAGYEYILERQLKPEARKDIVQQFKEKNILPTAMIDISDGLASDIMLICKDSGIGCDNYEEKIPFDYKTFKMAEELNSAGGKGGKKADEQRIMQRVQLNLAAALVYINGVAERSKGKVAQAQRGNHIRAGLQYRAAQDICRQQVPVFVIEQKPHTGEHRQKQENHPHGTYPAFADHQPAAPCDQCCRNQTRYQLAVVGPPAVKQVAGSQQTVRAQNTGQGIVQKRHCRKKAKK